ncbi:MULTISPECIES: hypothetical protein [Aeromonas]|uniref:Uncharacterized protein n=1 Tax=Aeromonas caviae TaxID=648 RepID=A0AAV4YGZ1_AERCA|nr:MULTISPECIES: hypothetical protein [Aeromonas]WOQ13751.1 hypothetical protein R2X36_02280 [Aeromonas media]BDN90921.1 hypothetical protein KAM497c_04650 [Aeromonas caviae]GJA30495.1 hypothetical protein KAM341_01730 [Aeromonas caviae]GJA34930.1 hypothetical protein KAM342_01730 [Aeromonas caviae]GJA39360.1 hypothetical protein KAM343_01560 [Aeromonas caviae]
MVKPDRKTLLSLLRYDPFTGNLIWKANVGQGITGNIAGTKYTTYVCSGNYPKATIILFMLGGIWIDPVTFKDRNRSNTKFENLVFPTSEAWITIEQFNAKRLIDELEAGELEKLRLERVKERQRAHNDRQYKHEKRQKYQQKLAERNRKIGKLAKTSNKKRAAEVAKLKAIILGHSK